MTFLHTARQGIPGVPEQDDVNVSQKDISEHFAAFHFQAATDIGVYERLLTEGFDVIAAELEKLDQIFVDTKFEFGYVKGKDGRDHLIYMDEVGYPIANCCSIFKYLSAESVSHS